MSPIHRHLHILILATLLFGCATARVPGKTQADSALQNTVIDKLKQLELAYQCPTSNLTVTDTKITVPFDGRRAQEEWIILSCNGETHAYEVDLSPSPKGGTDAGVKKWPD